MVWYSQLSGPICLANSHVYFLNCDGIEANSMCGVQIRLCLADLNVFKVIDYFSLTFKQPKCYTKMAALMLLLRTEATAEEKMNVHRLTPSHVLFKTAKLFKKFEFMHKDMYSTLMPKRR